MRRIQPRDSYDRYARFYDATFGRLFSSNLVFAIQRLELAPGARVLDVGIGTGLTLEYYPRHARVTGIDLCQPMLAQAERRLRAKKLHHARVLAANAQEIPLPDDSFDAVLLGHMLAVADNPNAVLHEVRRVSRPGALIAVVNHFQYELPLAGQVEQALSPLFARIGWRTDFRFAEFRHHRDFELQERVKRFGFDLSEVAVFRNRKVVAHPAPMVRSGGMVSRVAAAR